MATTRLDVRDARSGKKRLIMFRTITTFTMAISVCLVFSFGLLPLAKRPYTTI